MGLLLSGQQVQEGTRSLDGSRRGGIRPKWRSRWLIDDCPPPRSLLFIPVFPSLGSNQNQTASTSSLTPFL